MAGRRLVVSDIHGHGERLLAVLAKANYDPTNDRLFLLGDYIDRGPDSVGTLRIVRNLAEKGAVVLPGNHEDMMVRAYRDPNQMDLWMHNGGYTTLMEFGGEIPHEWVEFVLSLPKQHEEPDCILVHAGLFPGLPLEEQSDSDKLWIRGPFLANYRGKRVIFGHTPTRHLRPDKRWEPWYGEDKLGIDTGAAFGGVLTLLDIDTNETWTA